MGILDDIKRLGLELNDDDKAEMEALFDRAKLEKKDEIVLRTMLEFYLAEYFTTMRPDIMSVLEAEKQKENKELLRQFSQRYDDKGKRICDETGCLSTDAVVQCEYCERYVCAHHNYKKDGHCCYACHLEYIEKKKQ
ncbi:MAG: hypothetical protein C0399_07350 [Syntrophus sp. (in: bacteria)]|nr:hypothetical protein [Syntrophus sp. (in: bacteria)]